MEKLSDEVLSELIKREKKKRKQGRFSKFIVTLVIILNVIFTSAVLFVFLRTGGSEPTTLIVSWFAFTTGELWMLSSIKKKEVVIDARDDSDQLG